MWNVKMHHPDIWFKYRVPLEWALLPENLLNRNVIEILEARDNLEIQLMIDYDNHIWWRRDLNGEWELGL